MAPAFLFGHVTVSNQHDHKQVPSGALRLSPGAEAPKGNRLSSPIFQSLAVFTLFTKWLPVSKRNKLFKGL